MNMDKEATQKESLRWFGLEVSCWSRMTTASLRWSGRTVDSSLGGEKE